MSKVLIRYRLLNDSSDQKVSLLYSKFFKHTAVTCDILFRSFLG